MAKAKKILKILLILTVAAAVVYSVCGIISLLNSPFTSFPWWTAPVFAGIYFGPVILIEAIVLLVIRLREKRK